MVVDAVRTNIEEGILKKDGSDDEGISTVQCVWEQIHVNAVKIITVISINATFTTVTKG